MNINYTLIFQAVIALLTAVITGVVIPYIKAKTTLQQQARITQWVSAAVSAAEQLFISPKQGEAKMKYVCEFLAKHDIHMSESELKVLIESAVQQLNSGKK